MRNKISLIELLNRLAKNKNIPKKIKVGNQLYLYDDFENDYIEENEKEILDKEERTTGDIFPNYYLFKRLSDIHSVSITKQLNEKVEIVNSNIKATK